MLPFVCICQRLRHFLSAFVFAAVVLPDRSFCLKIGQSLPVQSSWSAGGGHSDRRWPRTTNQYSSNSGYDSDLDEVWDLELCSPSRLTLFHRVLGKRPDGFYEVAALYQTVGFGDILRFQKLGEGQEGAKDEVECTGPNVPVDNVNLVLQALALWREKTGVPLFFRVQLEKLVPPHAGLAAPASNAATALFAANELGGAPARAADLAAWAAAALGSDTAFFLLSRGTALASGRGDTLTPLEPLAPCCLYLVVADKGLPAPLALRRVDLEAARRAAAAEPVDVTLRSFTKETRGGLYWALHTNDLEPAALRVMPELGRLKEELQASYFVTVGLSGGAPTLYALGEPFDTHLEEERRFPAQLLQDYRGLVAVTDARFVYRAEDPRLWYKQARPYVAPARRGDAREQRAAGAAAGGVAPTAAAAAAGPGGGDGDGDGAAAALGGADALLEGWEMGEGEVDWGAVGEWDADGEDPEVEEDEGVGDFKPGWIIGADDEEEGDEGEEEWGGSVGQSREQRQGKWDGEPTGARISFEDMDDEELLQVFTKTDGGQGTQEDGVKLGADETDIEVPDIDWSKFDDFGDDDEQEDFEAKMLRWAREARQKKKKLGQSTLSKNTLEDENESLPNGNRVLTKTEQMEKLLEEDGIRDVDWSQVEDFEEMEIVEDFEDFEDFEGEEGGIKRSVNDWADKTDIQVPDIDWSKFDDFGDDDEEEDFEAKKLRWAREARQKKKKLGQSTLSKNTLEDENESLPNGNRGLTKTEQMGKLLEEDGIRDVDWSQVEDFEENELVEDFEDFEDFEGEEGGNEVNRIANEKKGGAGMANSQKSSETRAIQSIGVELRADETDIEVPDIDWSKFDDFGDDDDEEDFEAKKLRWAREARQKKNKLGQSTLSKKILTEENESLPNGNNTKTEQMGKLLEEDGIGDVDWSQVEDFEEIELFEDLKDFEDSKGEEGGNEVKRSVNEKKGDAGKANNQESSEKRAVQSIGVELGADETDIEVPDIDWSKFDDFGDDEEEEDFEAKKLRWAREARQKKKRAKGTLSKNILTEENESLTDESVSLTDTEQMKKLMEEEGIDNVDWSQVEEFDDIELVEDFEDLEGLKQEDINVVEDLKQKGSSAEGINADEKDYEARKQQWAIEAVEQGAAVADVQDARENREGLGTDYWELDDEEELERYEEELRQALFQRLNKEGTEALPDKELEEESEQSSQDIDELEELEQMWREEEIRRQKVLDTMIELADSEGPQKNQKTDANTADESPESSD